MGTVDWWEKDMFTRRNNAQPPPKVLVMYKGDVCLSRIAPEESAF